MLETIAHTIWEKKGENIIVLDVRHLTTLTEYFVIATGNVDRHVIAIGDAVIEKLKKQGVSPFCVEGTKSGDWLVVDFGDVYLHVMTPEMRDRYRLEQVWGDSKIVEIVYGL